MKTETQYSRVLARRLPIGVANRWITLLQKCISRTDYLPPLGTPHIKVEVVTSEASITVFRFIPFPSKGHVLVLKTAYSQFQPDSTIVNALLPIRGKWQHCATADLPSH